MNRERWFNLFWIAFALYVLLYVGGEAGSLFNNLFPSGHHGTTTPEVPYHGLTPVEIGEQVMKQQGCLACHQIGLEGGQLGPSLSNVGVRRSETWLHDQLNDPQQAVPGNYMPSYQHLTQQERDGLVAYMLTLNGDRVGPETIGPVNLVRQERFTEAQIERGQQLFAQSCSICHVVGEEGRANGPNLTHAGLRGRTDEWQKQHLIQPLSVYVEGPTDALWLMPSFGNLSDAELDALVAYLQSLQ